MVVVRARWLALLMILVATPALADCPMDLGRGTGIVVFSEHFIIALRPDRDGRISHYDNKEAIEQKFGGLIIDGHFPPPGSPTGGVDAGYMANAWLRMKHPDYDTLRAMLNTVGENLKVRATA